jgi:hypothetical protein
VREFDLAVEFDLDRGLDPAVVQPNDEVIVVRRAGHGQVGPGVDIRGFKHVEDIAAGQARPSRVHQKPDLDVARHGDDLRTKHP